jgi:hypothetical protein
MIHEFAHQGGALSKPPSQPTAVWRPPLLVKSEISYGYTSPWSIIAFATFRKPAMFAPFT